ncbi:MAG: NADH-quinone oxidoreductase subunit M [Verrucomicrobia bacterium]|nr:NADH-quinone oxidoreductase subunit M [Verrucomicrobiota bacterium]
MNASSIPWLTLLTAIPLVGGILILGSHLPDGQRPRRFGLLFHALSLGVLALIFTQFDPAVGSMQMVERWPWIPSLGTEYHLGIDGLGLLMLALSCIVLMAATAFSRRDIPSGRIYHGLLLLLQAGLHGAFTAQNFIHWFFYYELSLIPAYFLVKLWGGPKRGVAARTFFLYTMAGSAAMLLGFLATYAATGSFDFAELAQRGKGFDGGLAAIYNVRLGLPELSTRALGLLIFFAIFLGFAVKIPVWPFQSWLPLTYSEAPAPVAMVLTGALSKLGVYGLLRIVLPIFPEQVWQTQDLLLCLALASIVFSAVAALAQTDVRRMLGHLSISHLGYCVLAVVCASRITPLDGNWEVEKQAALTGAMLQMFNHGVIAALLFGLAGWMEERVGKPLEMGSMGGLRQKAPVFAGIMGLAVFASMGLPGLSGFVGEFLIFKGVFALVPWAACLATLGLLGVALFLLNYLRTTWHGALSGDSTRFADLTVRERAWVTPMVALILLLGVHPQLALKWLNAAAVLLTERIAI